MEYIISSVNVNFLVLITHHSKKDVNLREDGHMINGNSFQLCKTKII